jgi:hypothetical protein
MIRVSHRPFTTAAAPGSVGGWGWCMEGEVYLLHGVGEDGFEWWAAFEDRDEALSAANDGQMLYVAKLAPLGIVRREAALKAG